MNKVRLGLCLFLFSLFLALPTYAGCKSDCEDEYQSAKEECNSQYDEPDDSDELKSCLDDCGAQKFESRAIDG